MTYSELSSQAELLQFCHLYFVEYYLRLHTQLFLIFLYCSYACRKCQLVFPRKESCIKHQATSICSLGKTSGGADSDIVKIEQEQYHCQACNVNTATVQEYKQHCAGEPHKYNRNKYNNNNNNNTEPPSSKRLRAV